MAALSTTAAPQPHVVLLHGWGSSATVFDALLAALAPHAAVTTLELPAHGARRAELFPRDPAVLLDWLHERIPAGAVLVGWSLGGLLGMQLALRHPGHLAALVTIAASPCFLARDDWPCGMAHAAWDAFRDALQADPTAQLARFVALQARGDTAARAVARTLQGAAGDPPGTSAELLAALDALGTPDLRMELAQLALPVLHVLGEHDAIVDARIADAYRRLQPRASVWVVPGAAHAPFIAAAPAVALRIADFIASRFDVPAVLPSKQAIAASFGRAAVRYDTAAALQQQTGAALLATLPACAPRRVLDLGCGTGFFTRDLAGHFPQAQIIGVDIAEGMLHEARRTDAQECIAWLGGDAEQLPLAADSIDLVFSNLALQWCADPQVALAEIARVLRRGGLAAITTLVADTLWELRAAWRSVDDRVHVNRFESVATLEGAMRETGLRLRELTQHDERRLHADVRALAHELRAIGAHNLNEGRATGLAGRTRWRRLQEAYAPLAGSDGALPSTWRVLRLVLGKP